MSFTFNNGENHIFGTRSGGNESITLKAAYGQQLTIQDANITGAWTGDIITGTYGGTGVNNGSRTLTTTDSITVGSTGTANQLFYTSSANNLSGLATANNGVLITSAGGVPSISSTLPSAVQSNITSTGTVSSGTWTSTVNSTSNITAPNFVENVTSTATAAGTTSLTASSNAVQVFTGTTTQNVNLPDVTTLTLGRKFYIINQSTGIVTVRSSGSNNILPLSASKSAYFICVLITGTTAASWNYVIPNELPYVSLGITSGDASFNTTLPTGSFTSPFASSNLTTNSSIFSANTSTGLITVNYAGVYYISAFFQIISGGAGTYRQGIIYVDNVVPYTNTFLLPTTGSVNANFPISATFTLSAGQTVAILGRQDSGGNLTMSGNRNFTIVKIA